MRRIVAAVLAAGIAVAGAGCGSAGQAGGAPTAGAGYQAGDGSFTLYEPDERGAPIEIAGDDLDGGAVDSADWAGDVVVVNFWYAACPPCRAEAPDLKALAEEFGQVRFVGVNPRDDVAAAKAFEDTFETPYPTVLDPKAQIAAATQGKVPLQAMPTTLVLDRAGRVSARVLGRIDPDIVRGLIEDALAEDA